MCTYRPSTSPSTSAHFTMLPATAESVALGKTDSSGARKPCITARNKAGKIEGSGRAPRGLGMLSYLMPLAVRIPHISQITRTGRRSWSWFRSACLLLHFSRGLSSSELLSSRAVLCMGSSKAREKSTSWWGFAGPKCLQEWGAQGLCQSWAWSRHPHNLQKSYTGC